MPRKTKLAGAVEMPAGEKSPVTRTLRPKPSTAPSNTNAGGKPRKALNKKTEKAAVGSPATGARATKTGRVQKKKAPATKKGTAKRPSGRSAKAKRSNDSNAEHGNINAETEDLALSDAEMMEDEGASEVEEVIKVQGPRANTHALDGIDENMADFGLRIGGTAGDGEPCGAGETSDDDRPEYTGKKVTDKKKGTSRWEYNWKENPRKLFPKTIGMPDNPTVPKHVPKINIRNADFRHTRSIGDNKGEIEYIAKRPYDMMWKAILEPARQGFEFTGYDQKLEQDGYSARWQTERWDTEALLNDDHKTILKIHDDFAERCTVTIGMAFRDEDIEKFLKKYGGGSGGGGGGGGGNKGTTGEPGKYPNYKRKDYVTNNKNQPVFDRDDYDPNPARVVLPMTTFTIDHPLLVTDSNFNPGRSYEDAHDKEDDRIIESWGKAVDLFLREYAAIGGYPRVYSDGAEDQTISGANGRKARIEWGDKNLGSWVFTKPKKSAIECTLRGTGVPWGGFDVEKGHETGGGSCALDCIIMLCRYLGVFHRQGDKDPQNPRHQESWSYYLSDLTGPQRLLRKLIARDWDRTPKNIAYEAKQRLWAGVVRRDVTAGLEEHEIAPWWKRLSNTDFEMKKEELRTTITGKPYDPADPDPWDDPDYDPDKDAREKRIQALKDEIAAEKSQPFNTTTAPHLVLADAWNYFFGQHGPVDSIGNFKAHIYKQCWNFNIRFKARVLYCRTCHRLFHATTANTIPAEPSDLKKPYFEKRPYDDMRSWVPVEHWTDDPKEKIMERMIQNLFWSDGIGPEFEQNGGSAGNVCLACNPGWDPTANVAYQHPNPRTAPCPISQIVGEMPKQMVVQVQHGSMNYNSKAKHHLIRGCYSQRLTFSTIRATEDDPNLGEEQQHAYRFVGGIMMNNLHGNAHYRTYMMESEDTYRRYDGMAPTDTRGMTLGDLENEPENDLGIFCDRTFGKFPNLLVYERIDSEDPVDPPEPPKSPTPTPNPDALSSRRAPAFNLRKGAKRVANPLESPVEMHKRRREH